MVTPDNLRSRNFFMLSKFELPAVKCFCTVDKNMFGVTMRLLPVSDRAKTSSLFQAPVSYEISEFVIS